ncbi:Rhodanese-related sulfurtransferase [Granulicella rosea]|uniref:Rhodanese-related sulfurtransferase n=1 Tax=Granulicella rosea TaxID=474952 RepID=A0A239DHR0_9BACT|nr:rhodanese-like domain-containing protein [Granulicella rosea]SNS31481.1 Rhodanese-related sulfurtransferase [Granulicella rosea]
MLLATSGAALLCLVILAYARLRRHRRRVLEAQTIAASALHAELAQDASLLLIDVRQPLDLLAYPEMIPGATRIAPKDILEGRAILPRDRPMVVYCTCPGDDTSRKVLQRAKEMEFQDIRILRGGLAGWKAEGFPVQPYDKSFHLDTPQPEVST